MHIHILILGGDLVDAHTLGPLTSKRVDAAVKYAKKHPNAVFYAAAGVFEDFKDMKLPMSVLIAQEASVKGLRVKAIGPDKDFNTRGELRVFMAMLPQNECKGVLSAWWHLPRVRRVISREWGRKAARSWDYIRVPGALTLKLGFLETLKWVLTFAPESIRKSMVSLYRRSFGRSSW